MKFIPTFVRSLLQYFDILLPGLGDVLKIYSVTLQRLRAGTRFEFVNWQRLLASVFSLVNVKGKDDGTIGFTLQLRIISFALNSLSNRKSGVISHGCGRKSFNFSRSVGFKYRLDLSFLGWLQFINLRSNAFQSAYACILN